MSTPLAKSEKNTVLMLNSIQHMLHNFTSFLFCRWNLIIKLIIIMRRNLGIISHLIGKFFFFDMYVFELLLFCFLILVIQYFLRNPKKINFKKLQTYTKFFTDNKKVLELFGLFVSGIMIKMLYDIEKEPECKDIDIFMRDSLYYGNMIGFAVNTISILGFN